MPFIYLNPFENIFPEFWAKFLSSPECQDFVSLSLWVGNVRAAFNILHSNFAKKRIYFPKFSDFVNEILIVGHRNFTGGQLQGSILSFYTEMLHQILGKILAGILGEILV